MLENGRHERKFLWGGVYLKGKPETQRQNNKMALSVRALKEYYSTIDMHCPYAEKKLEYTRTECTKCSHMSGCRL
mgnify:CR=1 FL=1